MNARQMLRAFRQALEPHRDPARAAPMAAYLRDQFPFLGLPHPVVQAHLRPLWPQLKPHVTEALLGDLARGLWKLPEREFQYAALDLLYRFRRLLTPSSLPLIEELLQAKSWWDSVDALTTKVLWEIVAAHPSTRRDMDRWSRHANLWVRRAAILHQLKAKQSTDAKRLFRYCAENARDEEFFIRKAIGWALREYAKTDATAVWAFVDAHPRLSALSKREALRRVVRGLH
jgi:3-methyladenine DNA glycosylase AlkD